MILEQGHEVVAIFSFPCDNKKYNFNIRLKEIALSHDIKYSEEKITAKDIHTLSESNCDLIIVAGYDYKLPILDGMPKVINVHPTLLPNGKGRWPLPWLILEYPDYAGVTIHKVNEEWDSGDILIQEGYTIDDRDNLETISAKTQLLSVTLLSRVLKELETYWNRAKPQENGSYWPMPSDKDSLLDWNLPVKEIDKIVRAFGKFHSWCSFEDKEWLVEDASVWEQAHDYSPGTVVNRMSKEIVLAAKDGFVCLRHYIYNDED
jgi:methionyl-tRNA formyltransferase